MKAFISYSTKDKRFSGEVKSVLDEMSVETFLAHDDLKVSEKWKIRIQSELKSCKIFIPILSKAFRESDWCSQEIGIVANRRGVLIIPLSLDGTNPYGFISNIQEHRIQDGKIDKNILIEAIGKELPQALVKMLLRPMEQVQSFHQAQRVVESLVPYFRHFTEEQANTFAKLAVENRQIWDAYLCFKEYLPEFLKTNKARIKRTLYRALKYQIKNRLPYEA